MRSLVFKITIAMLFVVGAASLASMGVRAQDPGESLRFSSRLSSFNEVPPKAIGSHGTFNATLSDDGTTLNWTLTWTGLTGPPSAAHIHFAQAGVSSGVMTWLCGGPAGNSDIMPKPACPQNPSGSITGTTTAADIVQSNATSTTDLGVDLHDFAAFLRALRAGDGYANMHTARFGGGEIRGQLAVQ